MFNFIEDYIFYKCNEALLVNEDTYHINSSLQNKCEYRKYYKLPCSELLLYKVFPTGEIQNKYILVGEQDILLDIINNDDNIKTISELEDSSSEKQSENAYKLHELIHMDFVSLFFSFSKNRYTETIDLPQFKIECEKKITPDKLFYYETSSFEAVFSMLYFYILKNNDNLSININRENQYLEYLDMIYNLNNIYSFMNIYTFMETLESKSKFKIIESKNINDCNCSNKIILHVGKIKIDIECNTSYYLYRKPEKSKNRYCQHNVRALRHAIVHGWDRTNTDFRKDDAIKNIKKDFNEIMHLMISYIEQCLIKNK